MTFSAVVTASKPASFNSYFDAGIHIVSEEAGIDYTMGTKVTANSIEFASYEGEGATRTGAFSGSMDLSTGDLRYEGRMERIQCTTASSCGWNRHVRVYANMTIKDGQPDALKSMSLGYMDITAPPGQTGYNGILVSAHGDMTDGIKARAWTATNGSGGAPTAATQYDTISNWVEVNNTYCYTSASDSASTCGTGVGLFTDNTHFLLNDTTHTSTSSYLTNYAGMTFTAVDLNSDLP